MSGFVHLNVKSEYSLLNSILKTKDLVQFCVDNDMPSIAVTDINTMYNVWHYQNEAIKKKIQPIIGCTFMVYHSGIYGNIELYAKTREGYRNLVALSTIANTNFSDEKEMACIKLEDLQEYKKDLICLTGGTSGLVFKLYEAMQQDWTESEKVLEYLVGLYGSENVYMEFQNHFLPQEKVYLDSKKVHIMMNRFGIKPVATNDVYYLKKEYSYHRSTALSMIPESKKAPYYDRSIAQSSALVDANDEWYLKTEDEMIQAFRPWLRKYPDILSNTLVIAEQCKGRVPKEKALPEFPIPEGYTEESYFRKLCEEGFHERFDGRTDIDLDVYRKRFEYEFDVIKKMGFMDYHTITADFIQWAKDDKVYEHPRRYFPEDHYPDLNALPEKVWKKNYEILVGPGRGSAAGSLLCYCLKITNLDPIKDGLLFERFLNVERVSMPDIDVDFPNKYRYDVVEYVQAKYGYEKVCQIATFQTLGVKSIIKSLGKSLGMSYEETDKMTKNVPSTEIVEEKNEEGIITKVEKKIELLSQLEKYDFFQQEIASNDNVRQIFEIGKVLEGLPSTTGKHAAGVIIGRKNIMNYMPLMEVDGIMVSQFEKRASEDIGMLKMDFLGLQTLDILMETKNLIRTTEDKIIDFNEIPQDDNEVFDNIFKTGNTGKVFQFESPGMKKLLIRMKPTCLADLCAANAAYRPGPMQFIDDFINGRNNPESVKYPTKEYETIAEETKGILFYQEQVMQIVQAMAGFTLGEADILRRGIGKKIKHYIDEGRENFVAGCKKLGTADEKTAREIYATIEKFANYGFNKSHSDAYGLVAYWCAWLKYHYPAHFMAANCTVASNDNGKLLSCIREIQSMNIPLLPPDVRYSSYKFTLEKGETKSDSFAVRMSLSSVTAVQEDTSKACMKVKDKSSLFSFIQGISLEDINKRQLSNLISAGAFDYLNYPRKGMISSLSTMIEQKKIKSSFAKEGCFSIMSRVEFPLIDEEFSFIEKLKAEKGAIQICLSGHPVESLRDQTEMDFDTSKLTVDMIEEPISLLGCVSNLRMITTKKGDIMSVFELDDEFGTLPCVVFPRDWKVLADILLTTDETSPLKISGKLKLDNRTQNEESDEMKYQLVVSNVEIITIRKRTAYALCSSVQDYETITKISKRYEGMDLLYVVKLKNGLFDAVERIPWDVDLKKMKMELDTTSIRILYRLKTNRLEFV